uniref:Uncharacterized protein n=1 Tax=Anguilla anguilla TaxID=7936 RepID=A0A0E9SIH4_ANGAN
MYYFSAAMVLQCKGRHFFPSLSRKYTLPSVCAQ